MEIKAYSAIQKYSAEYKEVSQSNKTTTTTGTNSTSTSSDEATQSDKLTLSDASRLARLKELLGYDGRKTRLTRQEVLDTAASEQTKLETKLASWCKELGIESGTDLSISTDSAGNLKVTGAGNQSKALTEKLNNSEDFVQSYIRLEANQRFIDLPGEIMSSSKNSLLDYLDDSTNQLFEQQLSAYASYQQAPDSFTAMLMMTNSSTNTFSFDYSV